jgi:YbbR domain-containing protein
VVILDRASRRTVPIEPQFQVARGYDVTDVLLRDGEALLYGPANALERVTSVRAKIRSGALRLNSAKTVEFPLQALDDDGDVVEDVRLEPETVAVSAVLRESVVSARLPIEVKVVGDWPDNVEVTDVLVTPRRLTVRGPQRAVEGLKALPVTLSAPTGSTLPASSTRLRRRLRVPLPRRVRAVGDNEVLVTVLLSRNAATPDAKAVAKESPDIVTPTPSRTAPPLATPQAEVTDDGELPPARRDNTSSEVP